MPPIWFDQSRYLVDKVSITKPDIPPLLSPDWGRRGRERGRRRERERERERERGGGGEGEREREKEGERDVAQEICSISPLTNNTTLFFARIEASSKKMPVSFRLAKLQALTSKESSTGK